MTVVERPALHTRRDELLQIALGVLERDGSENFSVGEVARQAGIKTPSLYKQFAGKADIQARLIEHGHALAAEYFVRERGTLRPDASYRDRIENFATAYRGWGTAHPQLYRLMMDHDDLRANLTPGFEREKRLHYASLFPSAEIGRSFWAWAHGLLSLELARRLPADEASPPVDALWAMLVDVMSSRAK